MNITLDKDLAQIIYYLALSVTGPLALVSYLRARKADRREHEYRAYDELDKKYLEYQWLALRHDLDLLELPDVHPYIAVERPRKKYELVAAGCAFALFQRAWLMFHHQSDRFKQRQWQGWDGLLTAFLARPNMQDAWPLCRSHFDTGFQAVVDARIAAHLLEQGCDPAVVYAFHATGFLLRDSTEHALSDAQRAAWQAALEDYQARRAA